MIRTSLSIIAALALGTTGCTINSPLVNTPPAVIAPCGPCGQQSAAFAPGTPPPTPAEASPTLGPASGPTLHAPVPIEGVRCPRLFASS